jgi:serine/threonine protein phosphatase PrpC
MSRIQHSIASYGISDTGLQRANNQDHFIVADLTRKVIGMHENQMSPELLYHKVGSHGTLLAVADGLGGYTGGEVASQIAVEVTAQALLDMVEKQLSPAEKLSRAIEEAHQAICRQRQQDDGRARMGTTITALRINRGTMTVAQVGDSRAYLFRDGRLTVLTEDQTFVGMLLKRGLLTEEEAAKHPDRHVILQALGQDNAVVPEVYDLPFQHNDCLLLCTDGLSSYVSHERIETILASREDEHMCCRRLVDAANAAGGVDNVTVLVARLMVRNTGVSG